MLITLAVELVTATVPSTDKASVGAALLIPKRAEPAVELAKNVIRSWPVEVSPIELDWNAKFVSNLVRAGYMMKRDDTDADIVDRWFQNVCRHVVMETWEQEQAQNPQRYTRSKDIGDGRREVS